jgi:hypothetical protein
MACDGRCSLKRHGQFREHLDGCGFARVVMAKKPKNLALLDRHGQIIDRDLI